MGKRGARHASNISSSGPRGFAGLFALAEGAASSSTSQGTSPTGTTSLSTLATPRSLVSSSSSLLRSSGLGEAGASSGNEVKKKRADMTRVRGITRADPHRAWELSQTSEGRLQMLARFDEDTHTLPGHGVRSAQLATWEKVHHRWHPDEPVLPLTWEKIRAVAAHFKEAGYRSWSNYASRIKEEHVVAGYPWTLLLETCFRKAKRSVLRGIGPTKQSTPVGIIAVAALDPDDIIETPAMPVNIKEVYVAVSFFMLREIEAAAPLASCGGGGGDGDCDPHFVHLQGRCHRGGLTQVLGVRLRSRSSW